MLEKTLENPLDYKEIKPINPKGNQPWTFIGRTDAEADTLILWLPDAKSWLIGKDPDAGKDWRQKEKRAAEDKIVGWYHQLNGYEFEQTLRDGEGQGSLMSCLLPPYGLQKSRLPCPSLFPGVCSNSCPLSWWCHSTISSSVTPFSSCPQSCRIFSCATWTLSFST